MAAAPKTERGEGEDRDDVANRRGETLRLRRDREMARLVDEDDEADISEPEGHEMQRLQQRDQRGPGRRDEAAPAHDADQTTRDHHASRLETRERAPRHQHRDDSAIGPTAR